ncbi:unnamed protein product [Schistosoma margrebowiei]|uniref:Uncharacterized protein n=1 Tax=Schistosoma margrebowiei TaxID=48269 RepID=A0A183MIG2_9TREM|nr:unnamed protein product [Schistosoma margrebowiei]
MKTSTFEKKHGIQWTSRMQLDDLDFADDLALLSQTQQQIIIDEHGGSDADVKAWIGKTRAAYLQLKNIWNSKQVSTNTKQQPTIGENKPDLSGGRNQEEELEMDRAHIKESPQLHHKAKKERKTKEDITPKNGYRHKNEQLDRTTKEGPKQSGLENAGRRLMLHWE